MGKSREERALSALPPSAEVSAGNAAAGGGTGGRCRHCRWIGLRCVVALVLGVAVLLSSVFWILPFFRGQGDPHGADPVSRFGANIIASFNLQRSVLDLNGKILELQYDIYNEIGVSNSSVAVISLVPLSGSNWTTVVFGVYPYPRNSTISSASLSILRSYFVAFVIQQSTLRLTSSLFGSPSFFQVLEFPGGITITPPQNAFLLQKHIRFNFTLNFSIHQVQDKIDELKDQLRNGLHLAHDENLYITLTNLLGSTLSPPTIIQTAIFLAVGPSSNLRLKELAKAITGSPARNLGLNHTVFGRVKQIRLSAFLRHSLNSSNNMPPSPSPATQPHSSHHHHHHHHHNPHHHHHHSFHHSKSRPGGHNLTPAQAPEHTHHCLSSGCLFSTFGKAKGKTGPVLPASSPASSPASRHNIPTPHKHEEPSPLSSDPHRRSFPAVSFAHVQPPSKSLTHARPPDKMLPSSCCILGFPSIQWVIAPILYVLLQL